MKTKLNLPLSHFFKKLPIILLLSIVAIVVTFAYVRAQTGGETGILQNAPAVEPLAAPVPGGPGFIMVNILDFKPYNSMSQIAYSGTSFYNPSTTTDGNYVVGLTLPHGATITKLTLYYYDNTVKDAVLYLGWASEGTGAYIANVVTEGVQTAYRSSSNSAAIIDGNIDNQSRSYFLELVLPYGVGSQLRISNVRIDYQYTAYTPVIMR